MRKPRKNPRAWTPVFLLAILALTAANGAVLFAQDQDPAALGAPANQAPQKAVAHLYYGHPDGMSLMAEDRLAPSGKTPSEFGRTLAFELIAGPLKGGAALFPEETQIKAFFIGPDKTAYVDLSGNIREARAGSLGREFLSVYSLVNTLVLNVEGIDRVRILINGREEPTLAGHMDLSRPLGADMTIIR